MKKITIIYYLSWCTELVSPQPRKANSLLNLLLFAQFTFNLLKFKRIFIIQILLGFSWCLHRNPRIRGHPKNCVVLLHLSQVTNWSKSPSLQLLILVLVSTLSDICHNICTLQSYSLASFWFSQFHNYGLLYIYIYMTKSSISHHSISKVIFIKRRPWKFRVTGEIDSYALQTRSQTIFMLLLTHSVWLWFSFYAIE